MVKMIMNFSGISGDKVNAPFCFNNLIFYKVISYALPFENMKLNGNGKL